MLGFSLAQILLITMQLARKQAYNIRLADTNFVINFWIKGFMFGV